MALGVVHLLFHYRGFPLMERVSVGRKLRIRLMSTVGVCVIDIFLISLASYLLVTLLFFFLEFRTERIKSWSLIVISTWRQQSWQFLCSGPTLPAIPFLMFGLLLERAFWVIL